MPKAVQTGGAVAGSGAPSQRATVGPAGGRSAGFAGVPLPVALPRSSPPPALLTSREWAFCIFYCFTPALVSWRGGPGARSQPPPADTPGEHRRPTKRAPPPPESSATAFLGLARSGRRDVSNRGRRSRWPGAEVRAPGGDPPKKKLFKRKRRKITTQKYKTKKAKKETELSPATANA